MNKSYTIIEDNKVKRILNSNLHQMLIKWNYVNFENQKPIYTTKFDLK